MSSSPSSRKTVTRPPCQVAQCQAPLQSCLRPGMWLPGVRNLHSARETWEVKAGVEAAMDRLVAGVEALDTEESLEVHKVCGRERERERGRERERRRRRRRCC